jgi:TPR repeat protein
MMTSLIQDDRSKAAEDDLTWLSTLAFKNDAPTNDTCILCRTHVPPDPTTSQADGNSQSKNDNGSVSTGLICICGRCMSNSIEVAEALLDKSDSQVVNSMAYWRVAMRYWLGVGCTMDHDRSRSLLYKAAQLGHTQARIELAKIYVADQDDLNGMLLSLT